MTKDRKARWKWESDDLCEVCEEREDINHLLYICPMYNVLRSQYPALDYYKTLENIFREECEQSMKQIVQFLKAANIQI